MMKNYILPILLTLLFVSCTKTPKEKAEELIKKEYSTGVYNSKPTFVFENDLEKMIDKKRNELIGYTLLYSVKVEDQSFNIVATFDKEIENITNNEMVIETETSILPLNEETGELELSKLAFDIDSIPSNE